MSFRAWADLPAHHAASLSRGRPPGYRKAGALPAGGRKNTAGLPAWLAYRVKAASAEEAVCKAKKQATEHYIEFEWFEVQSIGEVRT